MYMCRFFLLCFVFVISETKADDLRQLATNTFGILPDTMPGSEHDTPAQIALGKALYFEKALSGNATQSCNTCHQLENGGVDGLKTSPGAFGKAGTRNSLSTWNAGFQPMQFWDGRVDTLAQQAKLPILNPLEMALSSPQEAVNRLQDKGYSLQFSQAFPDDEKPLNFDNAAFALAAFQRTLVTHDRFDQYLLGDDNALSKMEKRGLKTLINSGCNACHGGPLMGGQLLMKMGLVNPYPNTIDKGRAEVTGNAADNFLFKVPPLRNVAQTAPYFHDGEGASLEDAVIGTGWHQLGIKFTPNQVEEISAFLRALSHQNIN